MEGLAAQLQGVSESADGLQLSAPLRCKQPPLSRSCPSQSILCWRLRWRYKGSAISPNQSPWVSDTGSMALVRLASQFTSPLAQCCFLIFNFSDANSVSAFYTSNFTWVCLQRTDPGTLLSWAMFRGPSQKYSYSAASPRTPWSPYM